MASGFRRPTSWLPVKWFLWCCRFGLFWLHVYAIEPNICSTSVYSDSHLLVAPIQFTSYMTLYPSGHMKSIVNLSPYIMLMLPLVFALGQPSSLANFTCDYSCSAHSSHYWPSLFRFLWHTIRLAVLVKLHANLAHLEKIPKLNSKIQWENSPSQMWWNHKHHVLWWKMTTCLLYGKNDPRSVS